MVAEFDPETLANTRAEDHDDVKGKTEVVEDVFEAIDTAAERKLVHMIDLRLIPILFTLYLCAFIDR